MSHYDGEKMNFYEIAIKTAIELVEFEHFDSSKKEEFLKCLHVIKIGSIDKKNEASKRIYGLLKGIDTSKKGNFFSSYVESKLEKVEANLGKLSFEDREIIIDEIKSNPNVALEKYISEYITYCKISEKEKQGQEKDSILPSDILIEETNSTIGQDSYFESDTNKKEKITKMEQLIQEKLSQKNITRFNYLEEEPFHIIFNSTDGFYSFKTVEDALEIKRLLNVDLNKVHLFTEEKRMMELGLLISEILPKYLTQYSYNNDANNIFDILEVPNLMSIYDQAYSNYGKYFNALSQSDRDMIGTHILDNPEYVEKFSIEEEYPCIITPESLKITINEKVREEIVKNHKSIIEEDDRLTKLSHATKMMEVEEIADLYKSVKLNIDYMIKEYASTEESLLEYNNEILQYQWLFAEIIRQRITSNDKNINASLTEEQIRLKENEEIVKICMGIFHEKPLDPNLSEYVNSDNVELLQSEGEKMLSDYESTKKSSTNTINSSKRTIKKKVFDVDRLKRTISSLFGDSKSKESIQDNPSIDQTSSGKVR